MNNNPKTWHARRKKQKWEEDKKISRWKRRDCKKHEKTIKKTKRKIHIEVMTEITQTGSWCQRRRKTTSLHLVTTFVVHSVLLLCVSSKIYNIFHSPTSQTINQVKHNFIIFTENKMLTGCKQKTYVLQFQGKRHAVFNRWFMKKKKYIYIPKCCCFVSFSVFPALNKQSSADV